MRAPLKTVLSLTLVLILSACAGHMTQEQLRESGDFWQRNDITSALYVRGPKAQHQLNEDISSCVTQIKELRRLGSIRSATPPDGVAMTGRMRSNWDTPRRNGPMHAEYLEFHDFESCMVYQGWERVDYVTPDVANRAAQNYSETIFGIDVPTPWGNDDYTRAPEPHGEYGLNN